MRKKLKLGNIVRVNFLGSNYICEVIEVVDKTTYKARNINTGVIIPNLRWIYQYTTLYKEGDVV